MDLNIQDSCYFPTGHFQVIFCQQTFFNQQKTHHSSNSHVTSQDSDVTMLLNHAAGEGWTLQGWIFGALKKHGKNQTSWKVTPLSLRFVSPCVEMRSIFIHFSSLKKMIESPSFQIGGVTWRMIIKIQMFSTSWHFLRGIIFIQLKSLPSIQVLQSRRQSQVQSSINWKKTSHPKPPSEV